ncbi:MAG: aminotransferase class V-fold PLP-dependent enzyme, partial [Rikenellaceae bacterium]
GIGVLWAREELLEELPPFLGGGDMISTVSLTRGTTWAELPLKFEAGTTNYIGATALGEALDFCQSFDRAAAEAHQQELLRQFSQMLHEEVDGVTIYGTTSHKAPICSFNIEGVHPMDIAQIVDKLGVALRSGTHCAEPVMHHYGIHSTSRVSFAIYNTSQEVEVAISAIKRATSMLR